MQLALELMDLLQASIRGQPVTIGNDIFERLSARLGTRRWFCLYLSYHIRVIPFFLFYTYSNPRYTFSSIFNLFVQSPKYQDRQPPWAWLQQLASLQLHWQRPIIYRHSQIRQEMHNRLRIILHKHKFQKRKIPR